MLSPTTMGLVCLAVLWTNALLIAGAAGQDLVGLGPSRSALVVGFVVLELAGCAFVTILALTTPHFGSVSLVGALLGLAFFLGVAPLAVALRERLQGESVPSIPKQVDPSC